MVVHLGCCFRRLVVVRRTPSGSVGMNASFAAFRLCLFGFAPSRKALLLRSIVWTRFQFIVLTLVAVEENNLLRIFGLRHGVLTSGIALAARAFWTRDAEEAPASSDASASCYRLAENVGILAVIETELKLREVER